MCPFHCALRIFSDSEDVEWDREDYSAKLRRKKRDVARWPWFHLPSSTSARSRANITSAALCSTTVSSLRPIALRSSSTREPGPNPLALPPTPLVPRLAHERKTAFARISRHNFKGALSIDKNSKSKQADLKQRNVG